MIVHASSAPTAASHDHASPSAPASSERTTPSAAAQAASALAQTHAFGEKPPWLSPSAGTRTSGTAAAGAGRVTARMMVEQGPATLRRAPILGSRGGGCGRKD